MKWDKAVRITGVAALLGFAVLLALYDIGQEELILLVIGLIAIIAPEVLDNLPFGPNKPSS